MAEDRDVTALVETENSDDESCPLVRCVCGARFSCGRRLYFRNDIRVYEVVDV